MGTITGTLAIELAWNKKKNMSRKRTDNVTFSPAVIEYMINHSNQHS